jgi:pilus assembly protein Flp/PilA
MVIAIARTGSVTESAPQQEEIRMSGLTRRFRKDESGATATEYAMLIVFVALAIAVGAQALGNDLTNLFKSVGTTLSGITIPTP